MVLFCASTQVLLPEWAAFTEALKKTPDMDSLRELHEAFLSSVQRQCMARLLSGRPPLTLFLSATMTVHFDPTRT